MSVFACGNNTCAQILTGGPSILCCPSLVPLTDVMQIGVTFSHILWKTESGWKWTGYHYQNVSDELSIDPKWKVFVSENRTAAINNAGSIIVWEDEGWRTLHFQKHYLGDEEAAVGHHSNTKNQCHSNVIKTEHKNCNNIRHFELEEGDRGLSVVPVDEGYVKEICCDNGCKREKLRKVQESIIGTKIHPECVSEPKKLNNASSSTYGSTLIESQNSESDVSQIAFCSVALEDNALLALDKDGVMYSGSIPMGLGLKITEVAVGKEHSMALTASGDVLTWGGGMRGQLGNGEVCQTHKPELVEHLQGITISSIACGGWHSVALSNSGDAYVWGWNESGQLGFPAKSQTNHSIFETIEHSCQCPKSASIENKGAWGPSETLNDNSGKSSYKVTESLAESHGSFKEETYTQAVRERKVVNPPVGRVNQERTKDVINVQASPKLLDFWSETVRIEDVQCGDRHTLFLLDDGSAWSVGMNKYGQLGLGHTEVSEEPAQVFNSGVIRIYAGGWNSVFVTTLMPSKFDEHTT
nr:RCC1 domain-containing protein RUG3, mitochondrial-like [Procambarus clarkii]XP_045615398.1 RCC1 domain-containing protein RUG3, mitochondrial-like [Procambarus clarkii]XP_045615399.1 RCC1 domain-containing protein RUG3, mitochondrial-like [Procambarus clarkii]XP_045615400.1 RCC1 domain-containing protein RUG3, mitochondrial-like [Procambarus clarkii]XP_045615401.1 RCC1 domain-containing protein RUG3, mitochondrial-like [Procambarus clarkii]